MALSKTNITHFLTCHKCQAWKSQNYLKLLVRELKN